MRRGVFAVLVSGIRVTQCVKGFGDVGVGYRGDVAAQAEHRDDADAHQYHCDDCQYTEQQLTAQRPGQPPKGCCAGPSFRRPQHVSDTADGVDHRLPAGVDLLSQVRDVQVDDAGTPGEVVVPHPVEDLGAAQCTARIAHEEAQQFELGRRQRYRRTVAVDFAAGGVESEDRRP